MGLAREPRRAAAEDAVFEAVHADLPRFFRGLVVGLGDADALMRHAGIDPAIFSVGEPVPGPRPLVGPRACAA